MPAAMAASSTTPPAAPPAMAPTGAFFDFGDESVPGASVGPVVGVELGGAEPVFLGDVDVGLGGALVKSRPVMPAMLEGAGVLPAKTSVLGFCQLHGVWLDLGTGGAHVQAFEGRVS